MPDELDVQIAAYQRLLPDIRKTYGSVWALVVHEKLVRTFTDFSTAADYALKCHADDQILIRHTDEREEFLPLIALAD